MPGSQFQLSNFRRNRQNALKQRLQLAIKDRKHPSKVMKVGKPVDLKIMAENECAICLESLTEKNIAVTPCGHMFCFTCIATNLNVSKNCPMCRAIVCPQPEKKIMDEDVFGDIILDELHENFDQIHELRDFMNTMMHTAVGGELPNSQSSDAEENDMGDSLRALFDNEVLVDESDDEEEPVQAQPIKMTKDGYTILEVQVEGESPAGTDYLINPTDNTLYHPKTFDDVGVWNPKTKTIDTVESDEE